MRKILFCLSKVIERINGLLRTTKNIKKTKETSLHDTWPTLSPRNPEMDKD